MSKITKIERNVWGDFCMQDLDSLCLCPFRVILNFRDTGGLAAAALSGIRVRIKEHPNTSRYGRDVCLY